MNNFKLYGRLHEYMATSNNNSLMPLQEIIIEINTKLAKESEFNPADFIINHQFNFSTARVSRICHLDENLERYWENLTTEEQLKCQKAPLELYSAYLASQNNDFNINLYYLKNYDFTEEEILRFQDEISLPMLEALEENEKLVKTNLEYLKETGITNIKKVFTQYYEIFLMDNSNFIQIFNKYDREDLIEKLEKNVAILEYL